MIVEHFSLLLKVHQISDWKKSLRRKFSLKECVYINHTKDCNYLEKIHKTFQMAPRLNFKKGPTSGYEDRRSDGLMATNSIKSCL